MLLSCHNTVKDITEERMVRNAFFAKALSLYNHCKCTNGMITRISGENERKSAKEHRDEKDRTR